MSEQFRISIQTSGRGLYSITDKIINAIGSDLPESGLLNLFIEHTSASLTIQENAAPSAQSDLEEFMVRLVPDGQGWHQHTDEGPDDTTSHMKCVLTATSLNVPICGGKLGLGTWQGIYLWEHRTRPHTRSVVVTICS